MSSYHLHREVVLVDRLSWCGGKVGGAGMVANRSACASLVVPSRRHPACLHSGGLGRLRGFTQSHQQQQQPMLRLRWTALILIATSVSGMMPTLTVTIRSARSRSAQSASVLSLGDMEAEVDVLTDDDVCVLPLYYQEDELARRELASVEQAYRMSAQ